MRFGIELVPTKPIDKIARYASLAEESDLDYLWITDHYTNRDVYSVLTALTPQTSKINLGVGATNPYIRNPAVTAAAIASVSEISGGRAVLGMAAGDPATLRSIGIEREKPLSMVREAVEIIRLLLAGETTDYEGEFFKCKKARLNFEPGNSIPIYIGAMGPKMLELAGELGDGVLVNSSNPEDLKFANSQVKKGTDRAERSFKDIDLAAYTCFSVSEDAKEAKEAAKPVVAFIVAGAPESFLTDQGISLETASELREHMMQGEIGKAIDTVTDKMLDTFSICGAPTECLGKVEKIVDAGATQVVFGSPIGPNIENAIGLLQETIIHELE